MKRSLLLVITLALWAATTGCSYDRMFWGAHGHGAGACPHGVAAPGVCAAPRLAAHVCGPGCGLGRSQIGSDGPAFTSGPATGAVTYPYYTTHGPRDFLMSNPRSIGP